MNKWAIGIILITLLLAGAIYAIYEINDYDYEDADRSGTRNISACLGPVILASFHSWGSFYFIFKDIDRPALPVIYTLVVGYMVG